MRILALNDDNHDTYFVAENGNTYYNACELITKLLAHKHNTDYLVRGFWVFDDLDDSIGEKYNEDQVQLIFECVEGVDEKVYGMDITFEQAFNILWASSSATWH